MRISRSILAKRALLIVGFVLAVLAIDKLAFAGLTAMLDHSQFRFSKLYTGQARADYVVFGNSRGVHSALAADLGRTFCGRAMNMAYNGLSSGETAVLVADYLERNPAPKAIFVELSAPELGWMRNVLAPFSYRSQRIATTMAIEAPSLTIIDRLIWSRPLFGEAALRAMAYLRHDDQDWILTGRTITPDMKREWFTKPPEQRTADIDQFLLSANERRLAGFRDIERITSARGIPVVFYVAPFHPVVRQTGNARVSPLLSALSEAKPPNAILFDGSAVISDDRFFADRIHLNREGSPVFLKRLAADPAVARLSACSGAVP